MRRASASKLAAGETKSKACCADSSSLMRWQSNSQHCRSMLKRQPRFINVRCLTPPLTRPFLTSRKLKRGEPSLAVPVFVFRMNMKAIFYFPAFSRRNKGLREKDGTTLRNLLIEDENAQKRAQIGGILAKIKPKSRS